MTVYVDRAQIPAQVGRHESRWSHLTADTPEELHQFAVRIGLRRSYFQPGTPIGGHPSVAWHYDVTEGKRLQALRMGAQEIGLHQWHDILNRRRAAPGAAPLGCQALTLGPARNLTTQTPEALREFYDPCGSRATYQVTARCSHGHVITWHVCIGCADIIDCQASRAHAHCPHCRAAHITAPAVTTITPPVTPARPDADPGCDLPGCPDRGGFWACHRCGDAYHSTPPGHGLCPACTEPKENRP